MTRRPGMALALALLLLLTGCWQDSDVTPEEVVPSQAAASSSPQETEEVSLPASLSLPWNDKQTLDPVTCSDGAQQTVGALLYEGLYELDQQFEPQKKLCSGENYDAVSLTWTFTLRSGVTFSDGTALTAGDAAETLRRAMASDRYRARLSGVKSVSGSKGTVTVVLSRADTALPALLDIPIVKSGTEDNAVPLGTGPYVLVSDADGARLQANPSWWGGKQLPVQTIGLVACRDEDSVLYRFGSHEIQLLTADLMGTSPVSATGSVSFLDADTTTLQYIGFNVRRALPALPQLRQALNRGIDRAGVVSACFSGHAKAAQFPVSPASSVYPASLEAAYSYDDFRAAMAAAGYAAGKDAGTLTLIVNQENSFKLSAARTIADALSAFDVKIEVKALPWADFLTALQAGDYDLYYGEVRLTADWELRELLGTGGALNYGGYSDATLDILLASYAASSGRPAAMEAVCRRLQSTAPILPVCFKCTSVLSQEGVIGNLTPTAANPFYDLPTCVIHLAK